MPTRAYGPTHLFEPFPVTVSVSSILRARRIPVSGPHFCPLAGLARGGRSSFTRTTDQPLTRVLLAVETAVCVRSRDPEAPRLKAAGPLHQELRVNCDRDQTNPTFPFHLHSFTTHRRPTNSETDRTLPNSQLRCF
jgi:hypothetical protein